MTDAFPASAFPALGDARPFDAARGHRSPRFVVRLPGAYRPQADTRLLAQALSTHPLVSGASVLDVCTGTGALALTASAAGAARVTAVDLSARSALSARMNSRLHSGRVRVLRGDLFAPVAGERFDLVVCNPPYVPAADDRLPRHTMARCWDGGRDGRGVLDRVCAEVRPVLSDGGVLLLTHSDVLDVELTVQRLAASGLTASVVARERVPFGPVMRQRARLLVERGLIEPGQDEEVLVVIEARG